ncbi:hypothetical protein [Derxia lacustris]|uniref:hypothetical protein n=1 Tax=Derxia lacustris TaxID=764842 RepID=UPI000A171C1F|nr:hypothetical protein [Derxia lacustris]
MTDSSLIQIPGRDAVPPGHGTGALGPSDSSDSGSDVVGAGAALGDSNLDSDTDRHGTGERGSVGRDPMDELGADIASDREIDSLLDQTQPENSLDDMEAAAGLPDPDTDPDDLADAQLAVDEAAIDKLDAATRR